MRAVRPWTGLGTPLEPKRPVGCVWPHKEGQGVWNQGGSFIHSIASCLQDMLQDSLFE